MYVHKGSKTKHTRDIDRKRDKNDTKNTQKKKKKKKRARKNPAWLGFDCVITDLLLDAVVTIPAHGGRYPVGLVRGRLYLRWLLLPRLRLLLRLLRQQRRRRWLRLQLQVLLQISHILLGLVFGLCSPSNQRSVPDGIGTNFAYKELHLGLEARGEWRSGGARGADDDARALRGASTWGWLWWAGGPRVDMGLVSSCPSCRRGNGFVHMMFEEKLRVEHFNSKHDRQHREHETDIRPRP